MNISRRKINLLFTAVIIQGIDMHPIGPIPVLGAKNLPHIQHFLYFPVANDRFIVMERQTLLPTQLIPHSTQMYEMDYLGRVYRTYYVPNGIHHDVCEMTPGGNLLVASNSQCGHVEDCIAEVNRETGKIEKVLDI